MDEPRYVMNADQCLPSSVAMTRKRASVSLRAGTSTSASSSQNTWAATEVDAVLGFVDTAFTLVELELHPRPPVPIGYGKYTLSPPLRFTRAPLTSDT